MSSIMLVTEDKELSRVISLALRDSPAKISKECASAREAKDTFAKFVPDLVILDYFVPESSGLEILKTLKQMNDSCLFMMLSRVRTRNIIERSFRLGAHDVLTYPESSGVLRETILHRLEAQFPPETSPQEDRSKKPAR